MNNDMENRSLARSTDNRMLAGVCGGIAEYARIDATLVRLAFVVFTLFALTGVLVYVIAWLIIPERGSDSALVQDILNNVQNRNDR
ncbi:PspC domain-containing protein [Lipingzhangella sp. LS1_29]|uniref:PspC domain-containing protein n=1 Tax=Lipingzhangella rawalii TaxID=2055835 RepID=A0ABU2H8G2_9ACTN|nr:PspC domain-containing protein [Lipingzhangella rawalii]MDS1271563.1 PspC domain-containing protein [Lipingzhangella rawalii]